MNIITDYNCRNIAEISNTEDGQVEDLPYYGTFKVLQGQRFNIL